MVLSSPSSSLYWGQQFRLDSERGDIGILRGQFEVLDHTVAVRNGENLEDSGLFQILFESLINMSRLCIFLGRPDIAVELNPFILCRLILFCFRFTTSGKTAEAAGTGDREL